MSNPYHCTSCCWVFDVYGPLWPHSCNNTDDYPGVAFGASLYWIYYSVLAPWHFPEGWTDPETANSQTMVNHAVSLDSTPYSFRCTVSPQVTSDDLWFGVMHQPVPVGGVDPGGDGELYAGCWDARTMTEKFLVAISEFTKSDSEEPPNVFGNFRAGSVSGYLGGGGQYCHSWNMLSNSNGVGYVDGPELGYDYVDFTSHDLGDPLATIAVPQHHLHGQPGTTVACNTEKLVTINASTGASPIDGTSNRAWYVQESPVTGAVDRRVCRVDTETELSAELTTPVTVSAPNTSTPSMASVISTTQSTMTPRVVQLCHRNWPWCFAVRPTLKWTFEESPGPYTVNEYTEIVHGKIELSDYDFDLHTGTKMTLTDTTVIGFENARGGIASSDRRRIVATPLAGFHDEYDNAAVLVTVFSESVSSDGTVLITAYEHRIYCMQSGDTSFTSLYVKTGAEYNWQTLSECYILPTPHEDVWVSESAPGPLIATFEGITDNPAPSTWAWTLKILDMDLPQVDQPYAELEGMTTSQAHADLPWVVGANDKWVYVSNFPMEITLPGEESPTVYNHWKVSLDCTEYIPCNVPMHMNDPRWSEGDRDAADDPDGYAMQWEVWKVDTIHNTGTVQYGPQ